ncbi:MAG: hypothetical protein IPI07_02805 [Flavobacteriales bacterium]|nr:hypothetical protein [Flavobacteriales bacterium]
MPVRGPDDARVASEPDEGEPARGTPMDAEQKALRQEKEKLEQANVRINVT